MTAASNSEARKRAAEAASNSESAALAANSPNPGASTSETANGPQNATQRVRDLIALEVAAAEGVDSGAIGRLNEAERAALGAAGDHHPETCDCSPYVVDSGYAPENCCDGLLDTFAVVERIVREHTDRALAEVEQGIAAIPFSAAPSFNTGRNAALAVVRAARQERGR